jgi:NDP-sugar pyrophosphorylase family protein
MRAVVLAGGKGTRLKPYTISFPKPLVPIGDYPILEIIIRQLAIYDFKKITISTGHLAELIEAYFNNGIRWGVNINYVREERPLNTAGALKLLTDNDEHFLVINGDILTTLNYREMFDLHIKNRAKATIAVTKRQSKIDFGVLYFDEEGFLKEYSEKPVYDFFVSMGVYIISKECVELIKEGESIGMPDFFSRIMASGEKVYCHKSDCYWLDIGRIDDYEKAQDEFETNKSLFIKDE